MCRGFDAVRRSAGVVDTVEEYQISQRIDIRYLVVLMRRTTYIKTVEYFWTYSIRSTNKTLGCW